jgi:hypothetical protein
MEMLILVRYFVHSAGRVTGRYSHLGCWLAVEMVIDGRLRQGKALFSKVEFGSTRRAPWAAWRFGASVAAASVHPRFPVSLQHQELVKVHLRDQLLGIRDKCVTILLESRIDARLISKATQKTTIRSSNPATILQAEMMDAEHDSLAMFDTTNAITCGLSRAFAFDKAELSVDENGPVDLHSKKSSKVVTESQAIHVHQNIVMMGTVRTMAARIMIGISLQNYLSEHHQSLTRFGIHISTDIDTFSELRLDGTPQSSA